MVILHFDQLHYVCHIEDIGCGLMSQNMLTVTSVFAGLLSSSMSVLYCAAPLATVVQVTQTKSTCTVLYCTVLYCPVLYCTVLYCTVLYCTVLYCTVL